MVLNKCNERKHVENVLKVKFITKALNNVKIALKDQFLISSMANVEKTVDRRHNGINKANSVFLVLKVKLSMKIHNNVNVHNKQCGFKKIKNAFNAHKILYGQTRLKCASVLRI